MAQIENFIVKGGLNVQGGGATFGGPLSANLLGVTTASIATPAGFNLSINDLIIVDSVTTSTDLSVANYIGKSTINGVGSITTAVNLWIEGPPVAIGSTTINNKWAVYVNSGSVYIGEPSGNPQGSAGNALTLAGGISVGNGAYMVGGGTLLGNWYVNGSPIITAATQNTGTSYFNAQVQINYPANSYSTQSGALIINQQGGIGLSGNIYVGGYLAAMTTATILGTTPSVSPTTGALTVAGGLGVQGSIYGTSETLTGALTANTLQAVSTGTSISASGYIQSSKGVIAQTLTLLDSTSATGYLAAPLMVTGGGYIGANLIVGSTLSNALQVAGGAIIQGNLVLNGQGLFNSNINVATTSYINGTQILTSGTIANFAVTTLTAGTDTAVSTSYGPVLVWSTATLQSVTSRWATTTYAVNILNTLTAGSLVVTGSETVNGQLTITNATPTGSTITGALVVAGGVGIGGAIYVGQPSYIQNAQVLTTATLGNYGVSALLAGTDTAINTSTGIVTVWNISTLQSVSSRGSTTDQAISITNTSSSTSTTTGALTVAGGVGIHGALNVAQTATFTKSVVVNSNATITGQVSLGGPVTIANTTNAISTASGSLQVGGGVGIAGDLWVGGTLINTNNLTVNQNFSTFGILDVFNTSASTSTTTGAVVITGGLGVGGAGNFGLLSTVDGAQILTTATIGNYGVSALTAGTDTAISTSTGNVLIWNTSTFDSVAGRGNITTSTITVNNTLTAGTDLQVNRNLTVNGGTLLNSRLTVTNITSFQAIQDAIDTLSGAVRIAGGLGVANSIYAGAVWDQGARVVTTATIPLYAVTTLTAGTDTAVSTSTGPVLIWNTSTLQTITNRGNVTSNAIGITNTSSLALNVTGGAQIGTTLQVNGPTTLAGLTVTGLASFTNTTNSTSTTTGAVTLNGGLGVQGNIYASAIFDQSARVVTTASIGSYGVSSLIAGTDTAVSSSTGAVTVWNTSTLQTVTSRGSSTTNAINITTSTDSTSTANGALTVAGGVGIGKNLYVGGLANIGQSLNVGSTATFGGTATFGNSINVSNTSYVAGAQILTTATIAGYSVISLTAGTDTVVNTSTGAVTVWNNSTLQTVTGRGATTDRAITITNTSASNSTLTGALVVGGGLGIGGNLNVGGDTIIAGNLTVQGTQTYIDSTSTAVLDPVFDIGSGADQTPLITNDGLNKGIALHYNTGSNSTASDVMFVGRDIATGKFIVKNTYGTTYPSNANFATSGTYASAILGALQLTTFISSTGTNTGALLVTGGAGIAENLYVGGNLYVAGSAAVTTSTIGNYGVTKLIAGTDTAVSTSTGVVYVWNTSTLQTITSRGNSTTNAISITNTSTQALSVTGGVVIGGALSATSFVATTTAVVGSLIVNTNATVTNALYASQVYDNNNRVVTAVVPVAGGSIGITNITSTGTYTTFTVNNLGVTATIAGPFIGISTSTGSVTITNLGVQQLVGTQFLAVTTSTGTVTLINEGVTTIQGSAYIAVSTSTGTVQIFNAGVQQLQQGADISLSQSTGTILVAVTSTLATVTGRGNSTTSTIQINNTTSSTGTNTGALTVQGGVGVGGALYVANTSYVAGAQVITTATIQNFAVSSLTVGTDTAQTTSTGNIVIWSTATLQSITSRNSTTTNYVNFANTTQSISTVTGAVVIGGGLGLAGNLYIGGTLFYASSLNISSPTDSTSTTTGAITVTGGVGIGKSLNVGGPSTFWNTTNSTSTTTGAVTINGGLGVAGNLYAGFVYSNNALAVTTATIGNFGVSLLYAGTDTAVSSQTGVVYVWNTSTLQTITSRGNSTTNAIIITNTASSTSTNTGALTVAGGLGVAGNIYSGGYHTVGNGIYSIGTFTGAYSDGVVVDYATGLGRISVGPADNLSLFSGGPGTTAMATFSTGTSTIAGPLTVNGVNILSYNTLTYYVSNGGSDTSDGRRPASAFASIAKALTMATAPGAEVYIDAGTYIETFPLTVPKGVTVRGAGLRSTIVQPTSGSNTQTAFFLNGEVLISDISVSGFYKPGSGFAFAPGCKIDSKSPYLQRVSVITKGSTTSTNDPYGYAAGDAGNGIFLDASVLAVNSLEPAMLFNEVTCIVPNAIGMYMTNGVRAELLNGFFYFANQAIYAVSGTKGLSGVGQTRLKLANATGSFNAGTTIYYKDPLGNIVGQGLITSNDGTYIYITGPAWGFTTPITRTAKLLTFATTGSNISTAQSKFGGASLYLNGTAGGVYSSPNQDFQFGTGNFTIEGFVRPTNTGTTQTIIDMRTASTADVAPVVYMPASGNLTYYTNGAIQINGGAVTTSSWNHVALVRYNGVTQLYLNGVQTGLSYSDSNNYVISPVKIGNRFDNLANTGFNGYIDEVRISNIARYTTTFTVTNIAFQSDLDTVLLAHFDGANGAVSASDDVSTTQNIYSSAGGAATSILLADYHQFGAELRCIGSAAVFGNQGVVANGTGTDLKLIAFNMSHIGSQGNLSDDVTLTVQANEVVQTNSGTIYYQTVDQNGDFRVGQFFLVNQRTGNVTFNTGAINLNNVTSLSLSNGVQTTLITPGNILVGNVDIGGNTIGTAAGNLLISPATTLTEVTSNLQVDGSLNVIGNITSNGSSVVTSATIAAYGVATITAGTDTAVNTSFGFVTVWNTGTLDSVAKRGNATSSTIVINNNSASISTASGALIVGGGVGIGGSVWVGNGLTATNNIYAVGTLTSMVSSGSGGSQGVAGGLIGSQGVIWNSAQGSQPTGAYLQVAGYSNNTNPAVSKLSFLVGVNNSYTEQMYVTSQGLFYIGGGGTHAGSTLNDATNSLRIQNNAAATSGGSGAQASNKLILQGTSWNSAQGSNLTNGSIQSITLVNNANPTTEALAFAPGSGISGVTATNYFVMTNQGKFGVGISTNPVGQFDVVNTSNNFLLFSVSTTTVSINTATSATSTTTGALQVVGGVGIQGSLYAGNIYSNNSPVITQASLASQGVTTIIAGTDTAVNTATGQVTVWNTSTLQTITNRGSSTTNAISITNTSTATTLGTGALVLTQGGLSVGNNIVSGGNITASSNRHTLGQATLITVAGQTPILGVSALTTATTYQVMMSNIANNDALAFGLNSSGVGTIGTFGVGNGNLTFFAGTPAAPSLTLQALTGQVQVNSLNTSTSSVTGAFVVSGGVGIGGALYVANTSYVANAQIITTASISLYAVTSLTTGSGIAVTSSTGAVTISSIDTLQLVTNRGSVTTNTINVNNSTSATSTSSGALVVTNGGLGVGGSAYIGGNLYVNGSAVVTQGTLGSSAVSNILAGTDTAVSTATGNVVIWNTSTLASVTSRGNATSSTIFITNTSSSTGVLSGALQVTGGVGIGNNLYVQGTISAGGGFLGLNPSSIYQNTSSVTVIDSGTVRQVTVTIASGTNATFSATDVFYVPVSILSTASSTSTTTGALTVAGGVGIGGAIYVANTSYINGAQIITTATVGSYGVTTIVAGTDTASTLSGTTVYIWSTSTLQSITNRGSTTSNVIYITNSSPGGSANSGALQVAGGGYFGQNLYVGGNTILTGNLTVLGTQTTIYSTSSLSISDPIINIGSPAFLGPTATDDALDKGILVHYNTGSTTATDTHSFFGMQRSSEKFMYITRTSQIGQIGQDNPFTGYKLGGALFGNVTLNSGVNSTNTTSGDLQLVNGGAGIGGNLFVGGLLNISGTSTFTGTSTHAGQVIINNATSATNSQTGALIVNGGVGIAGNVWVGGYAIFVGGAQVLTTATLASSGIVNIVGGTDTAVTTSSGVVYIWNTSTLASITSRGNLTTSSIFITNTSATSSTGTGALVVTGGVGIGGSLYVGGTITATNLTILTSDTDQGTFSVAGLVTFTNTATSTSTTAGALVVTGGVGVGKDVYIGGITSATTATFVGAVSVSGTATIGVALLTGAGATSRGLNPVQVRASGNFATNGDAQTSVYVLRTVTSSTGILTTTGLGVVPTNQIVLPPNSTYTFKATVTARSITSNDEAGWLLEGVITQYTTVATTALRVVNKTKLYSSFTNTDCTAVADTVNGALQFTCSSDGTRNMRFVAKIETVEVTN